MANDARNRQVGGRLEAEASKRVRSARAGVRGCAAVTITRSTANVQALADVALMQKHVRRAARVSAMHHAALRREVTAKARECAFWPGSRPWHLSICIDIEAAADVYANITVQTC